MNFNLSLPRISLTACLILLAFLFSPITSQAQKYLQIESKNKVKSKKIEIGEKFLYKSSSYKKWQLGTIEDIDVDKNLLVLGNGYLPLGEIENLKTLRDLRFQQSILLIFLNYGIPALTYTSVAGILGRGWSTFGLISGGAAIVAAVLSYAILAKVFAKPSGEKHRYRLIDTNF